MIAFLVVLVCVVAYLAVGALYARSRAVDRYRVRHAENERYRTPFGGAKLRPEAVERHSRRETLQDLTLITVGWPGVIAWTTVVSWLEQPITAARDQAAQLRADADAYDALISACADPTDRELMRAGQQALRDRAREVDL